ncbi:hypothetical protein KAR91_50265 [Candidatus Pacearchaeota archaeon]|nr:hypothetical protein [Candidatus Pacearchaeota archaeon]
MTNLLVELILLLGIGIMATIIAFVINRGLNRHSELSKKNYFEGNSEQVYLRAERDVMRENTPSIWVGK